ncbi:MAG TPA: hypothetical protein PKK48_06000, partial [Phycisphaerae bacterium]|nr:hypothetical protein [Phycisphaerae bacterium]
EVKGNMGYLGIDIAVNSDNTNPSPSTGSTLDLIDVAGNFYVYGTITHGTGGDIKYIHVGGSVYEVKGLVDGIPIVAPVNPITYSNGRSSTLNDDSGGQIILTPSQIFDDNGQPVYDANGDPTYVTYSYYYIPVNDSMGGVGGVIANITANGSITLTATGEAEISDLSITGEDSNVILTGSGTASIYYAHGAQINSFINYTDGNIISGKFTGVSNMLVNGSIGSEAGATGAWLYGYETAPTVTAVTTQPQYGWFHGKINGLNISGDIDTLNVGGSLHDLRVDGTIGTVVVNYDRYTDSGDWDGVNGIVWSGTRINSINVGDGLADDGSADIAEAAIMSAKSIGTVMIEGPYYTENGMEYGLLNGSIIAYSNDYIATVNKRGVTVYTQVDAINQVIGTQGARLTALVLGATLDSFQASKSSFIYTGGINTVSFSGSGAWINGAEISGLYVRNVTAGVGTYGIANTYITGEYPPANDYVVGTVMAGGDGMYRVFIYVNGGSIGTVKTLESDGDIRNSSFVATNGLNYISARNIINSDIHMPGKVNTIYASNDMMYDTVNVGAIGSVTVRGDFAYNSFQVANELSNMNISGDFIESYLGFEGPSTGYLRYLYVGGDISGEITSAGKIGSIISGGAISADISTTVNDWSGDVDLIQTSDGYTGMLSVAGTLARFVCYTALGDNPALTANGRTQTFDIIGGLTYLKVYGDMYASINVGGEVGTIDIDGTYYSSMYVNGSIKSFMVDGGLGGILGGLGARGELNVVGTITMLRFNTNSDLVADLTVGGSINYISLTGGDIIGNITSRYGTISGIMLNGGSIVGNIQAVSIGTIYVMRGEIDGNITTTSGSIRMINVIGNIDGNITTINGSIDMLNVTGSILAGNTIEAYSGIGTFILRNGNLLGNVISRQDLRMLMVQNGNIDGATISAQTGIGQIMVSRGSVISSSITSGNEISYIYVDSLSDSTIASGSNIGTVMINGNMTTSYLLAGYVANHEANITSLFINGNFDTSIVAAGIDPHDGSFWTLDDNTDVPGVSSINRVYIRGAVLG